MIWGGVRDLQQIAEMPDFQIFHRGTDPRAEEYRHLNWDEDMEVSRKAEQ